MDTQNVKIAEIMRADQYLVYIRHKVNEEKVTEYTETLKDADKWVFPPLIVCRLIEKDNAKEWKAGLRYALIDGEHRIQAARACKMREVPVVVSPPLDAKGFYAAQFAANARHGQSFTLAQRNAAITTMRLDYKMQQAEISRRTGLSVASVSRIIRGIQAVPKPRKKGGGRPRKITDPSTQTPSITSTPEKIPPPYVFSVQKWYENLTTTLQEFISHQNIILQAKPLAKQTLDSLRIMEIELTTRAGEKDKTP